MANTVIETGGPVAIKDEGLTLTPRVGSIDFTGLGISGTIVGDDVTEDVPGNSETSLNDLTDVVLTSPTSTQLLGYNGSNWVNRPVVEADITLAANTTNNATTVKHGFLPQLPGTTTLFLRGDGAFAAPASVAVPNGYVSEAFAYTAGTPHNIVHTFGAYPVVQAFDSTGLMVIPQVIQHTDTNTTAITFNTTETLTVILTLGSPPFSTITSVSDNYNVLAGDYLIKQTGASKTVTLPTAVGRSGKIFIVKNSSTGICDVIFTGGQNADGYTDVTIAAGDCYSFMSDNSNYLIF